MAATNLYTYADMFRCKDIKGADLVHLDKEKLVVSGLLLEICFGFNETAYKKKTLDIIRDIYIYICSLR